MQNFFKKILILIAVIFSVSFLANFAAPTSTYADGGNYIPSSDCNIILGLTSWNCGVTITNEDSLKAGIWTIAANVATDITIIAAYLIVGFIIYGGYLYIFSGGEPGKVAAGKKTLNQAFIGFAITLSAYIIMNVIRIVLIGNSGNISDCVNQECVNPTTMVTNAIQWAVGVAGIVCAIFIVGGGIYYATSAGDPSKLQKAKNMILYALIGLVIVALVEIIVAFIGNTVKNATNSVNNPSSVIIQDNTA